MVKADEHFSGNAYTAAGQKIPDQWKPEMWDRNERAKKRAAKLCYRKGFTEINIPDREEGDIIDSETHEIKTRVLAELASENTPTTPRSAAVILNELGYDSPAPAAPAPASESTQPEPQQPQLFTPPTNGKANAIYQAVVDAKLSDTVIAAKSLLANHCRTGYDTPEKAVAWARLYRGWKDSGLTTIEAAAKANAGEILA